MNKEFDINYWNVLKVELKQKFPVLTNSDLLFRHGTEEDLLKMIARKLGKTKKELQAIIDSF